MSIPEKVAIEGLDAINKYKEMEGKSSTYLQKINLLKCEIEEVENKIKKHLDKFLYVHPSRYYDKVKERTTASRHFLLQGLTQQHGKLVFEYIRIDNLHTSIKVEMYNNGWLEGYELKNFERRSFGEVTQ